MKKPPYGTALADRISRGNIPQIVFIMVGSGAWDRARHDSATAGDCHALVWDGGQYEWPVSGCCVRVDVGPGGTPTMEQCKNFAALLIRSGAIGVMLYFLDRADGMPLIFWQDGMHAELDLSDLQRLFGEKQ